MGRDALRFHREEAGGGGDRGRDHRLLQGEARPLQMPEPRGVHRATQDLDRQDPKVQAARGGKDGVSLAGAPCRGASRPPSTLETLARGDGRMSYARWRGGGRQYKDVFTNAEPRSEIHTLA